MVQFESHTAPATIPDSLVIKEKFFGLEGQVMSKKDDEEAHHRCPFAHEGTIDLVCE